MYAKHWISPISDFLDKHNSKCTWKYQYIFVTYGLNDSFKCMSKDNDIETANQVIDYCMSLCGNTFYQTNTEWLSKQNKAVIDHIVKFIGALEEDEKLHPSRVYKL